MDYSAKRMERLAETYSRTQTAVFLTLVTLFTQSVGGVIAPLSDVLVFFCILFSFSLLVTMKTREVAVTLLNNTSKLPGDVHVQSSGH